MSVRVRLFVFEPLALDPFQRLGSPFLIAHAERNAVVVPEVKFAQVAVQVALPAVSNGSELLTRIGVEELTTL